LNFYRRLIAEGSVEEQAIRIGVWVAGLNFGGRVLQLLKIVTIARLLSSKAFGLLGISMLTLISLRRFSQLGFDEALIHHPSRSIDPYLDKAWVLKIIRGLLVTTCAYLSAPHLGMFFNEPRVVPLIRALGISPLLVGFQNPAIVYFAKTLSSGLNSSTNSVDAS